MNDWREHEPASLVAGWRGTLRRVFGAFRGDNDLWSVSAGVAFYAWYASVFGVVFLVSLYGLGSEPGTVRAKIDGLNGALPAGAVRFLADQMQSLARAPAAGLGTSLAFALLVALWSARTAVATLIVALNITFEEREKRDSLRLQLLTAAMTVAAALFVTTAVALTLLLPEAAGHLTGPAMAGAVSVARWPLLAVLMWLALAILYRFAPCRSEPRWRWASSGAAVATVLWILGSTLFSYCITHFSSGGSAAFGALDAVLVMQTWFYITALAVLLGAKLNAEAERKGRAGGNTVRRDSAAR